MAQVKNVALNRRALYDYEVLERMEAGLVLTGTEIKSVRAAGQVSLQEAFARPEGGELWLYNLHIAPYAQGNIQNHDPTRPRKLLLHREQVAFLAGNVSQRGLTIVPLRLYLKGHWAKVELGLARGRKRYDKRQLIAQREAEREIRRFTSAKAPPS